MKMKHMKYLIGLTIGFQLLAACSDDFIDVDPKGTALEDNYYKNADEAFNGLVAAYDPLGWKEDALIVKTVALNSASDDFNAGGGSVTDQAPYHYWNEFKLTPVNGPQKMFWNKGFSGVFRTNILIQKLPGIEMDETLKSRFMAEVKFLRAYYYFDLIRLFKSIPLVLEPLGSDEIYSVAQVERSIVFDQIEKDLLAAIPDLPTAVDRATEGGRATEGAARALLGRVYLHQEKFPEAAAQLMEVNGTPGGTSQFGYELLDSYAQLWSNDNKFNTESIFEISYNSTSNTDWGNTNAGEGNVISILVAPRGYSRLEDGPGIPNYVGGYGFNPPTESLVAAFKQGGVNDPRYVATMTNIDSLGAAGKVKFDAPSTVYDFSGYILAKFAGRKENQAEKGTWELNFPTNEYEIRLADTYLMEAEALVRGEGEGNTRAQELLDAVRARVGLGPIPATFDNIFAERRLELAGEGHRWFDLLRTGKAEAALAGKGFIKGKHEFLPIPQAEIDFDKTLIKQDPAYQ